MDFFRNWCEAQRESLRRQVDLLSSGKVGLFEIDAETLNRKDMTQERLALALERLGEIDRLIARSASPATP
jgi:hypothetical protein